MTSVQRNGWTSFLITQERHLRFRNSIFLSAATRNFSLKTCGFSEISHLYYIINLVQPIPLKLVWLHFCELLPTSLFLQTLPPHH